MLECPRGQETLEGGHGQSIYAAERRHKMTSASSNELCVAGKTVLGLAAKRGHKTQAAIRKALLESESVDVSHQKFSQWVQGEASFPNDFAEIFARAYDLTDDEKIELALALSFGQKRRLLLSPTDP